MATFWKGAAQSTFRAVWSLFQTSFITLVVAQAGSGTRILDNANTFVSFAVCKVVTTRLCRVTPGFFTTVWAVWNYGIAENRTNTAVMIVLLRAYNYTSLVVRKPDFPYAKTKTQISCAVTAQLISAFVFAIQIVQSLYYLNLKFQASSHLL